MIKNICLRKKIKHHKSLEKCFEMSLTGEELSSLVSLTEKSQDHSDVAPSLESLSHSFLQEIRFDIRFRLNSMEAMEKLNPQNHFD